MVDFITELIRQSGYIGIALLMILENLFPPMPSELVMPFAGFVAMQGDLTLWGVIVSGTIGSVLGTFFWYGVARLFGEKRLKRMISSWWGRVLTMSHRDLDVASEWFDKYGLHAIFFGRLLPAIRTLISIPAGIVKMKIGRFLLFTTLGSLIWVSFLTFLGVMLDANYEIVEDYLDPVSKVVLFALIAIYLYRFITYKNEKEDEVRE